MCPYCGKSNYSIVDREGRIELYYFIEYCSCDKCNHNFRIECRIHSVDVLKGHKTYD